MGDADHDDDVSTVANINTEHGPLSHAKKADRNLLRTEADKDHKAASGCSRVKTNDNRCGAWMAEC